MKKANAETLSMLEQSLEAKESLSEEYRQYKYNVTQGPKTPMVNGTLLLVQQVARLKGEKQGLEEDLRETQQSWNMTRQRYKTKGIELATCIGEKGTVEH